MKRGQAQIPAVIFAVILSFSILLIGVGVMHGLSDDPDGTDVQEHANLENVDEGTYVKLHDSGERGIDQTAYDSRGNAVHLTGAGDSYVQSDQQITLAGDDTWTVATWAEVDTAAANVFMTAISANGRVLIQYDGPNSRWSVYYYDDGSANSYRANVTAPNQPGNYSLITATHNGTHLTVWRNTTKGDVVNTSTSSNIEGIGTGSQNWVGRLEETRTFDDVWNDSLQSDFHTNPIDPIVHNRTARLMYDRGRGTTVLLFWGAGDATLSNGTWVDGLPGQQLDEKTGPLDIVGGNDYRWDEDGPRIQAIEGGELQNAPVVWVDYTLLSMEDRYADDVLGAFDFAATVPAIILMITILGLVAAYRRHL